MRVLMLAPFLVLVSALRSKKAGKASIVVPWFAVGFVAVSIINSIFPAPAAALALATKLSGWALAMAMAGLGIDSNLTKMKAVGPKPLLLATILFAHLLLSGY